MKNETNNETPSGFPALVFDVMRDADVVFATFEDHADAIAFAKSLTPKYVGEVQVFRSIVRKTATGWYHG